MTLGEKLRLVMGIRKYYGTTEGNRYFKGKYDVNDDGRIDWRDLSLVLHAPICRKHYKQHGWWRWGW
jgi:hypothetical protein